MTAPRCLAANARTSVEIRLRRGQHALKSFLAPHGTVFEGWCPLGHGDGKPRLCRHLISPSSFVAALGILCMVVFHERSLLDKA